MIIQDVAAPPNSTFRRVSHSLSDAEVVAYLFLCNNSGVVVQCVAQDIATHALA